MKFNTQQTTDIATLPLNEVRDFFESEGYSVYQIQQEWRNATGLLVKDNTKYFFKVASTPIISDLLKNEVAWTAFINEHREEYGIPIFCPPIVVSGMFHDLFWYIREYVEGIEIQSYDKDLLHKMLPVITKTAGALLSINTDTVLPVDEARSGYKSFELFLSRIDRWHEQIGPLADDLVALIDERKEFLEHAVQHGDFVPWHFFCAPEKTYLIDGELAEMRGIRMYDIAYFYHTVYTKISPEEGELFLTQCIQDISFKEHDTELLQMLIAQRILSAYRLTKPIDTQFQVDPFTHTQWQTQLMQDVLQGRKFI